MTVLAPLPVPAGKAVLEVLPQLEKALNGEASWLPVPAHDRHEAQRLTDTLRPGEAIHPTASLVVATSGTTGVPKGAMLSAAALHASIAATYQRIGGPGKWVLALPAHHIAGLQVLLRSLVAGTTPAVIDVTAGFEPQVFAAVTAHAARADAPLYTSLVPGQLGKTLENEASAEALLAYRAVLIGGAALPEAVRERANSLGVRITRTYGMSETCGGCVYDGVPLDGARVRIDDGRVILGGPMLASGYRNFPDHPAFAEAGWFRTDDAGSVADGVLTVRGRLDEAISSGGLTVVPQVVEAVLAALPGVRECAVFGLPDARLGERVAAALVTAEPGSLSLADVRETVADQLGRAAAPRELFIVDALPLLPSGKVDRAALRMSLGN
ncbi:o-succinylbenzoate--CoA ligase [Hoyosella sp. YIM 151337]|uniref:o-succinylbenzoate--CoA ligase n=1 Tax=Hoyosella sp. YIM 151337 TaxID=2992742 RepID=UPI0022354425|nr:o-succinylbenzoate--CoA ligase [Hoyosella sp. YIM 151337]MCW4352827.1 o-succinylbenzoate--CoA ligase [Hoyosella sp. YIM 151337]